MPQLPSRQRRWLKIGFWVAFISSPITLALIGPRLPMLLGSTLGYVSNAGGILVSGLACAFFFARIEAKTKRGFVLIMMFFGPVFIIYALIVSDMLWRWLAPKE